MRSKILTIIICSSFILSVILYSVRESGKYKEIREKGDVYKCEVTTYGGDVICYISYKGENIKERFSEPNRTIESGEFFKAYYYSKYEDMFYIAFDEPIIDYKKFNSIIPLFIKEKGGCIYFEYTINNIEYERFQETKLDLEKIDFSTYKVFYKKDNPSIAYAIKSDN